MIESLFVFALGLCIGSFLNVLILRTKEEKSLSGRSQCMTCKMELKAIDLIPVVSFLALRGKCRQCGSAISVQYPLVEFATGLLFLIFFLRFGQGITIGGDWMQGMEGINLLRVLFFISVLVVLFVYDLKYYLILDRFTVPAVVIAVLLNLWIGIPLWSIAVASVGLALFFFAQYAISRGRWIGGGDIRMGALMGAMLGFPQALVALFLSYAIGAIVGLFLLGSNKSEWKTQVPFGTFLSASTIITLLFGEPLLNWYLGLLG